MPYLFNAENFALQLKEKSCDDGDAILERMLLSHDEKVREENRRLFKICHRVMKAESLSDIDDISLEDIAACIRIHGDYAHFYEKQFLAGELYVKFGQRLRNTKTVRNRRVL